jgi:hypothetical protein
MQKVKDKSSEKMSALADKIIEDVKRKQDPREIFKGIAKGIYSVDAIDALWSDLNDHWFMGPMLSAALVFIHVITFMGSYSMVSAEKTKQIAQEDLRPYLLDLATIMRAYFREPEKFNWLQNQMRKMGITDSDIQVYIDNNRTFIPIETLIKLWHRREISNDRFMSGLKANMIREDDIETMQAAFFQYPSISDEVLFAVREAYDEDFIRQAGLGGDMPNDFINSVVKLGMKEEDAKKYWYSHWVPPSAGQGYQMFQRGYIDEEELRTLLKVNDIMPNYRDNMIDIAYRVIGRVDIRRLYQDAVIEYEEMSNRYMAAGFNPDDAELLSDWSELHYGEDRRQRTRTDILKLYKLGTYSRQQAINSISDIGYSIDISEEYVDRVDLEALEKRKANKLKIWRKGFINYVFDEQQVRKFMSDLGIKKREADDNVDEWKVDRDAKIRFLGLKDIEKMYSNNIMNEEEVEEELSIQGYSQIDSQRLIQLWSISSG